MQNPRIYSGHPAMLRLFAGLLVLLCSVAGTTGLALSETDGLLPSLDSEPAAEAPAITPITDLISQPASIETTSHSKTQAESQPKQYGLKQAKAQPEQRNNQSAKNTLISTAPANAAPAHAVPKEVSLKPATGHAAESQPAKSQPRAVASNQNQIQNQTKPAKKAAAQPVAQAVKKNPEIELKPLLDESQASRMSAESGLGLTGTDPHTDLAPLHPAAQAAPELTPLLPQSEPQGLTQGQPEEKQPTLDIEPLNTGKAANSSAEGPALKGPALKGPAQPPAEQKPLAAKANHKAKPHKAEKIKPEPTVAVETKATEKKVAETKPAENALEKPVKPAANPFQFSKDVGQAIQNVKRTFANEKSIQPVSYSPLPGIAVFAVVKHGPERAFGDLPVLFAREYAQRLGAKLPETKVYNPIYTVDELRMQGLGHVYDQIMNYYIKTGAPEPAAMDYLLKQISNNRPNISRVIFVEADVDFSHPDASTGLMERAKLMMTDEMPKQMKYFVVSHLQVFDAEKPGFPIVWSGNWQRSIKTNQFYNVTPSVYADSDSQQSFARVSRQMSQEMLYVTPREAYMTPNFDTSVEGQLVSGKQNATPAQTDGANASKGLSHENKQVIERILQRQTEGSSR